jgi:hypothetical protein
MWRNLVGGYQFIRITVGERWILCDLDAPDRPIPVRISDLSGSLDRDPTVKRKGRGSHLGLDLR